MRTYEVTVSLTGSITLTVEANSDEEAGDLAYEKVERGDYDHLDAYLDPCDVEDVVCDDD